MNIYLELFKSIYSLLNQKQFTFPFSKRNTPCNLNTNDREATCKFTTLQPKIKISFTPTQLKTTGWNISSAILLGQEEPKGFIGRC